MGKDFELALRGGSAVAAHRGEDERHGAQILEAVSYTHLNLHPKPPCL